MFKIWLSNYVFGSEHDVHKCLIYILYKYFPSIDQCIFQNKVIESTMYENTNNIEPDDSSNSSLKKLSSKDLDLDDEDTHKLQSVQGLHDRRFDSNGWRIHDCYCGNCNRLVFILHLVQFQALPKCWLDK